MSGMTAEPSLIVIMGATGDLSKRKLLPALYTLLQNGFITMEHRLLGVALDKDMDDASFRALVRDTLFQPDSGGADLDRWCDTCVHYQTIGEGKPENYQALAARIAALEQECHLPGNRAFYLSLPTTIMPPTVRGLAGTGLNKSSGWTRVVIEKPFGRDLTSARELNAVVHESLDESQIYRIDHYLGKETVQNLLAFRFANAFFESVWNRDHVASVQFIVAEELGVEHRAAYYDHSGALRDMVQNHITQLVTLVAMDAPGSMDAEAIRYEKVKVLRAIAPIKPENVIYGQYARGHVNGEEVPGYREEPGIPADSKTPTFVGLKLAVDSWRWQGVPFYIRTGKRMPGRLSQIIVTFQRPPVWMFPQSDTLMLHANALVLTLQPNEGFALFFHVKAPGAGMKLETLPLHFQYDEAFRVLPEAYQTLILDVLLGDQTLFVHADEVEASWKLYTPLVEADLPIYHYPAGTSGPEEVERFMETDRERISSFLVG